MPITCFWQKRSKHNFNLQFNMPILQQCFSIFLLYCSLLHYLKLSFTFPTFKSVIQPIKNILAQS